MCGLDVPVAPTDDDVAEEEEEEEEVRINDDQFIEVGEGHAAEQEVVRSPTLGSPATNKSRSTGHGGTSRSVPGAYGAILAEEEANRTRNGQDQLSPSWPLITSS